MSGLTIFAVSIGAGTLGFVLAVLLMMSREDEEQPRR